MQELNIVLVDKEKILTQGIKALMHQNFIGIAKVTGLYNDYNSFLDTHDGAVSVVIGDIDIHDVDVIEVVPRIKRLFPESRVVILSNYDSYKIVRDMMKSGADGYILKSSSFSDLIHCVEEVVKGEAFIGEGLQLTPPKNLFNAAPLEKEQQKAKSRYEDKYFIRQKLTRREQEILTLIVQAKSNKDIAKELYISDQTVGVHRKNIMRKFNVRSTISLIKYAVEQNLV